MAIIQLITKLLGLVQDLLRANGDYDKEQEALMEAQETIKAELDRRKFGG